MIGLFIVGVPVLALSIWFYLRIAPPGTSLKTRAGFEITVFLSEIVACILATYHAYRTVGHSVDHAWWPVIASVYGLFMMPCILLFAAIIRQFIYKQKR